MRLFLTSIDSIKVDIELNEHYNYKSFLDAKKLIIITYFAN